MSVSGIRLHLQPAAAQSPKWSKAYELVWWSLDRSIKTLIPEPERFVAEYLGEIRGRRAQQLMSGKRPYGKMRFDYRFPDHTGRSTIAAALTSHWLELTLALWAPEIERRLRDDYGLELKNGPRESADLIGKAKFVELRGRNWSIERDGKELRAQGNSDSEKLAKSELNEEEAAQLKLAEDRGQCLCSFCARILPTDSAIEELTERIARWHVSDQICWWIRSLNEPTPDHHRAILSALARHPPQESIALASEVNFENAFPAAGRQLPDDSLIARCNDWNDYARAAQLAMLEGRLRAGLTNLEPHAKDLECDLSDLGPTQVVGMLALIAAAETGRIEPERWLPATMRVLDQTGEHSNYLANTSISRVLRLWRTFFIDGDLPQEIRRKLERLIESDKKWVSDGARALLDHAESLRAERLLQTSGS